MPGSTAPWRVRLPSDAWAVIAARPQRAPAWRRAGSSWLSDPRSAPIPTDEVEIVPYLRCQASEPGTTRMTAGDALGRSLLLPEQRMSRDRVTHVHTWVPIIRHLNRWPDFQSGRHPPLPRLPRGARTGRPRTETAAAHPMALEQLPMGFWGREIGPCFPALHKHVCKGDILARSSLLCTCMHMGVCISKFYLRKTIPG